MNKNDLDEILTGDISRIDEININEIDSNEIHIIVRPFHVKKMLLAYLAGKIDSENLTRWAYFICARTEYMTGDTTDYTNEDHYEDMWYVIQCLSTPEIDGEVNEKSVRQYLSELSKYLD